MKIPCLLFLQQDLLIKRALESLMRLPNSGFQTVTSEAIDTKGLVADILRSKPDAVLLSESMPMATKESLAQLLVLYPKLRVIVASENTNWLHIFHQEDMLLTRLADLLNLINSE